MDGKDQEEVVPCGETEESPSIKDKNLSLVTRLAYSLVRILGSRTTDEEKAFKKYFNTPQRKFRTYSFKFSTIQKITSNICSKSFCI
ncbi:unnamed protein product [marine sediment metagenome]|uniref:Uncharacterized protein n=1 Tax=marine sediment metagenome TaxID=412755 RepID=X1VGH7_9ZZZZ